MQKRTRQDYGPRLTKTQEKQLKEEIASFDKEKTLRSLSRNAVGKPDIDLTDGLLRDSDPRSNPDMLSEEEGRIPWGRKCEDPDIVKAQGEIAHLLSYQQKKVWDLVMRKGLSNIKAAERLGMDESTVRRHLQKATKKVKDHYGNGL